MKNLLPKQLTQLTKLYLGKLKSHVSFIALMGVLIAYILVVWQISQLSAAEPDPSAQAATSTQIPKVDQKAINEIQALEQSNTQVHSLFNQARNNPFQE
jgi:predicted negative regulator of RcsB-dependent stress response